MRFSTLVAGLAGMAALAGCAQVNAAGKLLTYNTISSALADAEITATMPSAGTAEYSGIAAIGAKTDTVNVALVGDAALTADFAAGTIDGTIDDFIGAKLDTDIDPEDLQAIFTGSLDTLLAIGTADGQVDVTNGAISGSTFTADFDGDVTLDDGTVVSPSGTMSGDFYGTDGELIEATAACDLATDPTCTEIAVTIDGDAADAAGLYLAGQAN